MIRKRFLCSGEVAVFLILFSIVSSAASDTQKGIQLYQAGEYEKAVAEFKQVIRENPRDNRALYYLGLSLLNQRRYKEAESEFMSAEKQLLTGSDPTLDQIKIGLARAQMEQKNLDKALVSLDEAHEINPENPNYYVYSGQLELLRGNPAKAIEQLEKAIKMDPRNAYAHYYAGIAYSKTRRTDKMIAEFQLFLKLAPDAPEAAKVRSLLKGL